VGGFGDVYMTSMDIGLVHEYVAIKKLRAASLQGQVEFLKEVQVLGACRYANILVY